MQVVAGDDGQHVVRVDLEPHGAFRRGLGAVEQDRVAAEGEAGVQIQAAVVILQAAGIELEGLAALADGCTVLVLDIAVELILAGGLVADRHGDHLRAAHEVVEIISAVGTDDHVGCRQAVGDAVLRSGGILVSAEDHAVAGPVSEIVHRCGPADIVAQAEIDAVESVVGSVDIHTAVHDVRFRVRNIFPARKIRIESHLLHLRIPPFFHFVQKSKRYHAYINIFITTSRIHSANVVKYVLFCVKIHQQIRRVRRGDPGAIAPRCTCADPTDLSTAGRAYRRDPSGAGSSSNTIRRSPPTR